MKNSQPKVVLVSKCKLDNTYTMQVEIKDERIVLDISEDMYLYILENSDVRVKNESDVFIFNHFY